ncbi:MAG: PhzF family phenazine biosynthesis protein [Rhizobiaceae bacterium]
MRKIDYSIFDVFTSQTFKGNPLGVVLDANGLTDDEMQKIAREFNLSETIFFQKPIDASNSAKVRIFMPVGELPFAGHPTIGGSVAWAGHNGVSEGEIILEEGVGPVRCLVNAQADKGSASFTVPRISQRLSFAGTVQDVANASGIAGNEIGFAGHEVSIWSAGVPFLMVPIISLDVLANLSVDAGAFVKLDVHRDNKIAAAFYYVRTGERSFQARMFAPWDGIPEDPATGSAAAAFSGAVATFDQLPDGHNLISIVQGLEMGRRSDIGLAINKQGGAIVSATISGEAVKVAQGTMFLPD